MNTARLKHHALANVDNSWLVALRVLLGLVMAWSAARYLVYHWVQRFFIRPTYFFTYPGFDWVEPLATLFWMKAMFVAMIVLGLMVALGLFFRVACFAFTVLFTWAWLCDVTNYLNHYYLLSLLSVLLAVSPAHRRWSLDVRLGLVERTETVARWIHWVFRAQVVTVYFYAGIAKLQPDWLIHAQPLNSWLLARTDYPLLGPLFAYWEVALAMSWAGFLFDTTIWAWLLWPKSRPYAYAVVLVFHGMTAYLFQIGIFPLIMTVAATVLFGPSWPLRLRAMIRRSGAEPKTSSRPRSPTAESPPARALPLWMGLAALWLLVQVAVPLRTFAHGGNVLWHEQGMKWSWRVMVRSKYGDVAYRLETAAGRSFEVTPSHYLTSYQEREMSTRPELILQLAHDIAAEYSQRTGGPVRIYARTATSLNSRAPAELIDPEVDLMTVTPGQNWRTWILPAPTQSPLRLGRRLLAGNENASNSSLHSMAQR